MHMKLKTIKRIWSELNRDIFTAAGMPLQDIPHRLTRATDYWACHDDIDNAFYWSKYIGVDFPDCVRSLIFHEKINQWQKEYLQSYLICGKNPHDVYFWGWLGTAKKHGLKLVEKM
jgi:hypothetical protein